MAESEQTFAEYEPEKHNCPENEYVPEHRGISENEFELQNVGVIDSEQQNVAVSEPENVGVIDSENEYVPEHQGISENEFELQNPGVIDSEQQNFAVSELENQTFGFIESEPTFTGFQTEQHQEEESVQNMTGKELELDSGEDELSELRAAPEDSHLEEKQEFEVNAAIPEEKKWPGWPGESVFRMLVPAQKVGNIIGRKGEYIKKIVEETRARIKILDGPSGTAERAVMVSAKEEPDSLMPPAMDGLLRVHKRIVDGLEGDLSQAPPPAGEKVSTRMLLPATQAGSLIGKQGSTVKSIQETSNCIVRVLGREELPLFALQEDRVVEVVGEPAGVHKAIELIASCLRRFLVDRSVIPLFEMQMQVANNHVDHRMPFQPTWGPPHGLPPNAPGGPGYGAGPQYMPPPRQLDNYYPPADMPDRQTHRGIPTYGRELPMGVHASSNAPPAPTMIAQITHHMQIPLSYADSVIGAGGASISYIRRASGSTVTVQETRSTSGEMTVEISGSASQVQAAQQLIQNFMADAAAAPAQTQPPGTADQSYSQAAYNPYAAPAQTYGSPPASTGYASQPGAYGSVYGGNYGY
ncbi:hypothetical protein Dimus_021813 [Dionaea muscipula]